MSKRKQTKENGREKGRKERQETRTWRQMCETVSAFSHFRIGIFTLTPTGLQEISDCPRRGFHAHRQDTALFCVSILVQVIKAVFSGRTQC